MLHANAPLFATKIAAVLSDFCDGGRHVGDLITTALAYAVEGQPPSVLVDPALVLAELIRSETGMGGTGLAEIEVRTDYGPSQVTQELGSRLGIPKTAWPYKAYLTAEIDEVGSCRICIKAGYRGAKQYMQLASGCWVLGPEQIPAVVADVVAEAIGQARLPPDWFLDFHTVAEKAAGFTQYPRTV